MATTVEDLVIAFSAETEKLSRDLKNVERVTERSGKRAAKSTNRIKKSLDGVSKAAKRAGGALIAAFAGGAAVRGIRETFSAMNDLQTASEGLGVSVEAIQELRFAWLQAGADASKVEKNLTDFIKRIGESRSNLGTLLPFLKEFNIDLDNVNGTAKTSEQLFDEIADIIAGLKDNTARAALGNAAFGRSWVDVVAVLGDGSAALKEVRKDARDAGAVIEAELVAAAAAADAQFNILALRMKTVLKRGTIIAAQKFGVVDKTELQETIALMAEQKRKLDLILQAREKIIELKGEGVFLAQLNAANFALLRTQALYTALTAPVEEAEDAIDSFAESMQNLDKEVKENRKDMLAYLDSISGFEEIEEGMKIMDEMVAKLQKRTIKLGPDASDSIYLISDAIEDTIFDLKNADDHVKNLIASFGRLIIQQLALKAASGITAGITGFFGFAGGGVMTSGGPMPLKTYDKGGIANTPQVAMFGEGKKPEAYVPLPDGRSIPVTIKGNGGGGGGNTVFQENHFGVGIERDVIAILMQFAPMIIEASRLGMEADAAGIRS